MIEALESLMVECEASCRQTQKTGNVAATRQILCGVVFGLGTSLHQSAQMIFMVSAASARSFPFITSIDVDTVGHRHRASEPSP